MNPNFKIHDALECIKGYVNTYDKQACFSEYNEKTFILDMLYMIGISISEEDYRFASGFDAFKKKLLDEGYFDES